MDAKIHKNRLTHAERLRAIEGRKERYAGPWTQLRGGVWLAWIFCTTGWSWQDLKERVGRNRERSALVNRWEDGAISPSRVSARKLAKKVPGSLEIFDLPLWSLLANRPRSAKECKKALNQYLESESQLAPYRYPETLGLGDRWYAFEPTHRDDSETMVMRADIYALTSIVALVREAEAEYRDEEHSFHLANLYRMLAPMSKIEYVRIYIPLLAILIQGLHERVPYTKNAIGVDWKLLNFQILSDHFCPLAKLRPHHTLRGEHALDGDPIIYGDIVRRSSIGSSLDLVDSCLSVNDN